MPTSYSYRTTAHWTEHKRGIVEAEGIPRTINFAAPPEFGGEPGLWTPEHLLLAAVSTCYVATLRAVAEASKAQFHARACAAGRDHPQRRRPRAHGSPAGEGRACLPDHTLALLRHSARSEDSCAGSGASVEEQVAGKRPNFATGTLFAYPIRC